VRGHTVAPPPPIAVRCASVSTHAIGPAGWRRTTWGAGRRRGPRRASGRSHALPPVTMGDRGRSGRRASSYCSRFTGVLHFGLASLAETRRAASESSPVCVHMTCRAVLHVEGRDGKLGESMVCPPSSPWSSRRQAARLAAMRRGGSPARASTTCTVRDDVRARGPSSGLRQAIEDPTGEHELGGARTRRRSRGEQVAPSPCRRDEDPRGLMNTEPKAGPTSEAYRTSHASREGAKATADPRAPLEPGGR